MDLTEHPRQGDRGGEHRRSAGGDSIAAAPSARAITPYKAITSQDAIEAAPEHHSCFKLDWNECTVSPSPRVRAAVEQWLRHGRGMNWYPRLGSRQLVEALTNYTGLMPEHLLVTNGSDAALRLICSTYLEAGDSVVFPVPTYHHFTVFARSRGATLEAVHSPTVFEPAIEAVDEAMSKNTRLLYLVSPNNPTGVIYSPQEVEALCRLYPRTLVVLDEAYYEFGRISGIDCIRRVPNLVVTRTFSKAFGLAGLRVGYLAASPPIIEGLRRLYNPKSVNAVAQIGAAAALEDLDHLVSYLAEVELSKKMLHHFFSGCHGAEAHITPANFVVLRVGDVTSTLQQLEKRKVYVRDRSHYPGLEGCLRMSVGTREQTRRLLEHIDGVFS